eukprot:scaffold6982_cov449-Prasinococcus_capsulatus_cf.AAC.8
MPAKLSILLRGLVPGRPRTPSRLCKDWMGLSWLSDVGRGTLMAPRGRGVASSTRLTPVPVLEFEYS